MTTSLPLLGFIVAIAAAPAVLLAARAKSANPLALMSRLSFWVIAVLTLGIGFAHYGGAAKLEAAFGLTSIGMATLYWGAIGASATVVAMGLTVLVLRSLGVAWSGQETYDRIMQLSFGYRLFIVTTAAVTEEVLYRGGAISFGTDLLGSPLIAAAISIVAFTLAPFRWRATHLIHVAMAATVLTALYLYTHDLWACMLAHFLVDAGGFLLPRRPQNAPRP